jgi:arylsulfatase A-like enzyme
MPKRKYFLVSLNIILLAIAILLFNTIKIRKENEAKKLNLILISVDTLRPDHMGIYGYEKNTTPNIDRFFENGIIFNNMNTVAPYTRASFAALFSEEHLPTYKKLFKTKQPQTLAEKLSKLGYFTIAFVDNMVLFKENNPLIANGFYEYHQVDGYENFDKSMKENLKKLIIFQKSKAWIDKEITPQKQPFFLWIHLMPPHYQYTPPNDIEGFNKKVSQLRQNLNDEKIRFLGEQNQGCGIPNQQIIDLFTDLYDSEIKYTDLIWKKLIAELRKKHLLKNSVVVLYGDHGEGFDHNYYFGHNEAMYQSGLHIPLLIKTPNYNQKIISQYLSNTQISKILLDLTFSKEIIFDNWPLKHIFSINHFDFLNKFSVIFNEYKYIFAKKNACLNNEYLEELYNLKKDPEEKQNLIGSKPKLQKELKTKLSQYLKQFQITLTH